MTGVEANREFQREIYKSYSSFYNPIKTADLFKKALFQSITSRYNSLVDQSSYDDLSGVIKLNKVFQLNNNVIYIFPLDIAGITQLGTTFIFNFTQPHNVNVGDMIFFTGIQGTGTIPTLNTFPFIVQNAFYGQFTFSITSAAVGVYTPKTGALTSVFDNAGNIPKMAADYYDLLSLKAKFTQLLNYKVTDTSNTSPIQVSLDTINNNIIDNDRINISGVIGNINANGDFYTKKINRKTFSIFYDKDLSNATSGNGIYNGIANLQRIFYKTATILFPNQKIAEYSDATILSPKIERGDRQLKIAPYDSVCYEISMDYISTAVVFIDPTDNKIDLEDHYPISFLYSIIEKAVQLFAAEVKDNELYQTSSVEVANPETK